MILLIHVAIYHIATAVCMLYIVYTMLTQSQTSRIIWSYYPSDPLNPTGIFPMHTRQGNKSLNLLGGLQTERSVPSDSANFTVRNNKACNFKTN